MALLEARARVLGALAAVLAVALYAVTVAVGGDVWRSVPGVVVLLAVVALPGWLLGRTGVVARVDVLLYEALVAYVTAAIATLGVLATGTFVLALGNGAITLVNATLVAGAPVGVVGYVAGMASTAVEDVLGW